MIRVFLNTKNAYIFVESKAMLTIGRCRRNYNITTDLRERAYALYSGKFHKWDIFERAMKSLVPYKNDFEVFKKERQHGVTRVTVN